MIKSLEAKFFRKHESLGVTFTGGLNVLRGANEVGKTTVTEAILYALYGSKSLRNTLAETVTWGHKEAELKVSLVIEVKEIEYTFTRSKAGAECNYHTGGRETFKVTGQAEVSAFAATLLGADSKVAGLLMLASQNGLRGALDDGPTAVSQLMGKLADFDMIDQIVEAAGQKLTLGSAQPLTLKLADVDVEIEQAKLALDMDDNRPALKAAVDLCESQAAGINTQVLDLQVKVAEADEAYMKAIDISKQHMIAEAALKKLTDKLADEILSHNRAMTDAAKRPDTLVIEALRKSISEINSKARELSAYAEFSRLPVYPVEFWEGTQESFAVDHEEHRDLVSQRSAAVTSILAEITALMKTMITSGKCPTCGHAAQSDEHVAEHNRTVSLAVGSLQQRHALAVEAVADAKADLVAFDRVVASAQVFVAAASKLHEWVTVQSDLYPPKISWNGPAPTEAKNSEALKRELSQLEAENRLADQAQGRVTAHAAAIDKLYSDIVVAEATLNAIFLPEIQPLSDALDVAYSNHAVALGQLSIKRGEADQLKAQLAEAERLFAEGANRLANAQARADEYRADLKALEFNNALVAKLRKLKPMITDYLWNQVLAAVSNFFSTLRGEQSVVTKGTDGFKVNGKSIDSLSGSTLDVLALAIRVALTKTFIPHASFLVLDEPAAGCDISRTGNVLGFLSSVGFKQTVLASHDILSENVAENIINLGD